MGDKEFTLCLQKPLKMWCVTKASLTENVFDDSKPTASQRLWKSDFFGGVINCCCSSYCYELVKRSLLPFVTSFS